MPRRNYARGRSRPHPTNPDSLRWLEQQIGRPRPRHQPSSQPSAPDPINHRHWCHPHRVVTFTGRHGDQVTRCTTCSVLVINP